MSGEGDDDYVKNGTNSLEENEENFEEDNYSDENTSKKGKMNEQNREAYLYELFDEEQSKRYDKYKSSSIEHDKKNRSLQKLECPRIKRIVQNILGEGVQIGNLVQIILNGVAKIYAGELVEETKRILVEEEDAKEEENKDEGEDKLTNKKRKRYDSPIRPRHLREARRRMIIRGVLPLILNNNTMFKKKKVI